ncbi:MAG: hypothetical protein HY651_08495 [Acidobacteria bacterium]|nr:hypothetical protein [Acidobacteriota bacterium]
MPKTVASMSADELRELVATAVEDKIVEMLGDADTGLKLRAEFRRRLLRQRRAVARGERGEPLETVARRLGL